MTGAWLRVDVAELIQALESPRECDAVIKAAALRKSLLTGETSPPVDCATCEGPHQDGMYHEPFPHQPHLPEHQHGSPVCILCGTDHDADIRPAPPAWIRYARQSPGYLAPPAGYQLQSVSIPPDDAA